MRSFQAVTGFVKGVGTAVVASGCAYLVGDAISDVITLRACHQLVLPLARDNQPLVEQLGQDLDAGPMFSSKMRSSPSGQIVQCQFRIDGSKRSSDVTATVQRPPYASTAVYNLLGPALWDLQNCHVLIGKKFHLWTFDSNCTGTKGFFLLHNPRHDAIAAGGANVQVKSVDLMRRANQPHEDSPPPKLPAHLFHPKSEVAPK